MDLTSVTPKAAHKGIDQGIASEDGRYGVRANAIRGWRFGRVEDVANAATFLLSAHSSWITGQTLNVDGGYSV